MRIKELLKEKGCTSTSEITPPISDSTDVKAHTESQSAFPVTSFTAPLLIAVEHIAMPSTPSTR